LKPHGLYFEKRGLEKVQRSCSREKAQKARKPGHFVSFAHFGGYMSSEKALVNAISGPAFVDLNFSALRLGVLAALR
jgi:hypothetical protein